MLEKQRKAYLSVNYMDIYSGTYLDWHLHEHLLCTTGENSPRCMNLDISCLSITGGLSLKKNTHIHYFITCSSNQRIMSTNNQWENVQIKFTKLSN